MKKGTAVLGVIVIYGLILIPLLIGWCMNVYKATQLDYEPSYKAEVIRIIGIFAPPVGAITGYITFDEEETQE